MAVAVDRPKQRARALVQQLDPVSRRSHRAGLRSEPNGIPTRLFWPSWSVFDSADRDDQPVAVKLESGDVEAYEFRPADAPQTPPGAAPDRGQPWNESGASESTGRPSATVPAAGVITEQNAP
jgi:hypothetical protein